MLTVVDFLKVQVGKGVAIFFFNLSFLMVLVQFDFDDRRNSILLLDMEMEGRKRHKFLFRAKDHTLVLRISTVSYLINIVEIANQKLTGLLDGVRTYTVSHTMCLSAN